jgi:biopolymer transport protein TolQ
MNNSTNPTSVNAWTLILDASPLVKLILLVLLFASVVTWAIIVSKSKTLRATKAADAKFLDAFWSAQSLEEISESVGNFEPSSVAKVFTSGYRELRKMQFPEISNLERSLHRAHSVQLDELEKHVDWLATTASAAPFVGLFGTVWGIMNSFQNIGATGSASLSVVAPGISEALIATAVGLAAAIPAAVAYNSILGKVRRISLEMETFSQEFLNMIQRNLSSSPKVSPHGNEPQQNI